MKIYQKIIGLGLLLSFCFGIAGIVERNQAVKKAEQKGYQRGQVDGMLKAQSFYLGEQELRAAWCSSELDKLVASDELINYQTAARFYLELVVRMMDEMPAYVDTTGKVMGYTTNMHLVE